MSSEPQKANLDLALLSRIVSLAKPYKSLFIWTIVLAVVSAPISMLRPFLVSVMVDQYILINDLQGLYKSSILFIILVILTAVMRYGLIYYSSLLGQDVVKDLRTKVFNHVTALRLRFFDQTPIGRVTTRTINDVETINTVFTQGVITMVADLLGIFAVLGIMIYTNWRLTLLTLSVMPLLLVATYIFKERVKIAFEKVRTQISNMNSFLQERITGMNIIQIFNAEKQEAEKFKKINHSYTQANLDAIFSYAIFFPVVEIINYLGLAILVYIGAQYVVEETVSLGALLAFPWYINLLFQPIRMLADKFNTLQMGMVAADRVFKVLDNQEKIENNGYIKPEKLNGSINFKNVGFSYDDENQVLRNINFELKPKETLAIVGRTGSGKTSIINVLTRYYDIQEGEISIDEINIKEYDLHYLRKRIAVVLQDVFLFHGSIFENITLKDPDKSMEEVLKASKAIGAHKFIENIPGAYEHIIMERGANLSMGQRQLISFVRALVFDPDILILDEATSSIDRETEDVIQFAIEKLIKKRTSIIIAHRLSTIKHANNIMVLDQGQIIEYGDHENLLKNTKGKYKELYEMQFADELSEFA